MSSETFDRMPGELRRVHAFTNTLDVEEGTDAIADPEGLASWLASVGLLEPDASASRRDHDLGVRLRDLLRLMVRDNCDGSDPRPDAATELTEVSSALPLHVRFDPTGEAALEGASGGIRGALATILADVFEAEVKGTWSRLKMCAADDCRWVFYDHSKNRSGRWCTMRVCGNRNKTRAYRKRVTAN
jgi:predicted RNA-binding Zn ribbon-like protein